MSISYLKKFIFSLICLITVSATAFGQGAVSYDEPKLSPTLTSAPGTSKIIFYSSSPSLSLVDQMTPAKPVQIEDPKHGYRYELLHKFTEDELEGGFYKTTLTLSLPEGKHQFRSLTIRPSNVLVGSFNSAGIACLEQPQGIHPTPGESKVAFISTFSDLTIWVNDRLFFENGKPRSSTDADITVNTVTTGINNSYEIFFKINDHTKQNPSFMQPRFRIKTATSGAITTTMKEPLQARNSLSYSIIGVSAAQQFVTFNVNVLNCQLSINGQKHITRDGKFAIPLPTGRHQYTIEPIGKSVFRPATGTIAVGKQPVFEQVRLETDQKHILKIIAYNTDSVFVDDQFIGLGSQQIEVPAGHVRLRSSSPLGTSIYESEADLSENDVEVNMSLLGSFTLTYPQNAEVEITPIGNSIKPKDKKIKTGVSVPLLGHYFITVSRPGYSKITNRRIFVDSRDNVKQNVKLTHEGDKYFYGTYGEKLDMKKAFKTYKKYAEKNDDGALYGLGKCHEVGIHKVATKDRNLALNYYKKSAGLGNLDACKRLYELLESEDEATAYSYLKNVADAGDVEATEKMAWYYASCNNPEGTVKYATLAKEYGSKNISALLGVMYFEGFGFDKNIPVAQEYIEDAIASGNPSPILRDLIGDIYYYGLNDVKDPQKGLQFYSEAARSGHKGSARKLGDIAYKEYSTRSKDPKMLHTAAQWYDIAIDDNTLTKDFANFGPVFRNIAYLYSSNKTYKDPVQEYKWFHRMYTLGEDNNAAIFRYALCYINGKGTERNMPVAFKLLDKLVSNGYELAFYNYGLCLLRGTGTGINLAKGFKYIAQAAKLDNNYTALAQNELGNCYSKGNGCEKNYVQAAHWYEEAAKRGSRAAMKNIAICYAKGIGVAKNPQKAAEWRNKAASR